MSSWDTSTGLLDDFTLDVAEAWFGKNDKFGTNLLLNLRGQAFVEGEMVDPEHTEIFTCGDSWKDGSGGAIAVSTTGAEMFNANSKVGRLIESIKGLGDDAKALMQKRGESFEAESWKGVTIDFERIQLGTFTTPDTKEVKDVTALVATGIRESEAAPAEAAEPTTASNSGASTKVLTTLLTALAKKSEDNDAFVAAALDPDVFKKAADLENDEELLDSVIDGSLYAGAN